jgi:hypothetical protein
MQHKGVEFNILEVEPNVWRYSFRANGKIIVGKTHTALRLLAVHRVKIRINRELARGNPSSEGPAS